MMPQPLGRPRVVPYVAAWSGEQHVSPPVIRRGFGIGYAEELPYDRDSAHVLWVRHSVRPHEGRPEFGRIHSLRQRRAMRRLLCQICGGPADRSERGVLWIVEDHRGDWPDWPERAVTTHPPLCLPCAQESVRSCPHLRRGNVALRVASSEIDGVYGARYRPDGLLPRAGGPAAVAYEDDEVRWVLAVHQTRVLRGCTVVDLADELTAAHARA